MADTDESKKKQEPPRVQRRSDGSRLEVPPKSDEKKPDTARADRMG